VSGDERPLRCEGMMLPAYRVDLLDDGACGKPDLAST
jgi:hypothetical protein